MKIRSDHDFRLEQYLLQCAPSGPCCLTSGAAYTGLENQFYRVEIQQPGTPEDSATPPAPIWRVGDSGGSRGGFHRLLLTKIGIPTAEYVLPFFVEDASTDLRERQEVGGQV